MSSTNHTLNYDLSQFVGGDIPSWLGDYNGDMGKIDAAIAEVASGAGSTASEVNSLKSRMTAAEADIDTAEGNITQLQTTTSSQGASISTNTTNIASLDTRVTALENAGGSDFDLTAHAGTTQATPSSGTATQNNIQYEINADYSVGKIYGTYTPSGFVNNADYTTVATISITGMPTRTAAKEIDLGVGTGYASDYNPAFFYSKLVFNTDGTIDIKVKTSGALVVGITLPPCIYFLNQ